MIRQPETSFPLKLTNTYNPKKEPLILSDYLKKFSFSQVKNYLDQSPSFDLVKNFSHVVVKTLNSDLGLKMDIQLSEILKRDFGLDSALVEKCFPVTRLLSEKKEENIFYPSNQINFSDNSKKEQRNFTNWRTSSSNLPKEEFVNPNYRNKFSNQGQMSKPRFSRANYEDKENSRNYNFVKEDRPIYPDRSLPSFTARKKW